MIDAIVNFRKYFTEHDNIKNVYLDFLLGFDENEPGDNRDLRLLSTEAAFHRERPQLQHDDQQIFALPSASTLLPPMQGRDSGTQALTSKAILIPSC